MKKKTYEKKHILGIKSIKVPPSHKEGKK